VTGLALPALVVLRFGETWLEARVTVFGASPLAVAPV
jgi:hypothetical protein